MLEYKKRGGSDSVVLEQNTQKKNFLACKFSLIHY